MPYGEMLNGSVFQEKSPNECGKYEKVKRFLEEYSLSLKSLNMSRYEREYFGVGEREQDSQISDEVMLRARMYEVKSFILSMPSGNERLLLYYHYVKGESVERCAELLGISRRSGFRLKKRAIERAAEIFLDT